MPSLSLTRLTQRVVWAVALVLFFFFHAVTRARSQSRIWLPGEAERILAGTMAVIGAPLELFEQEAAA